MILKRGFRSAALFVAAFLLLLTAAGLWWLALMILALYSLSKWLNSRAFIKKNVLDVDYLIVMMKIL